MPLINPSPAFNFTIMLSDAGADPFASPAQAGMSALGAAVGAAISMITGTFSEVSGLDADMEIEEYHEGSFNTGTRKFPKWGSYPNLVFKRGVTPNPDIWDWYYQAMYHTTPPLPRKNGIIMLLDRGSGIASSLGAPTGLGLPVVDRLPIATWMFRNALPKKLSGPSLNAKSNELAVESLELAHEGLIRVGAAMIPGVGGALASIGL